MTIVSCECGWSAQEPSKIQAQAEFDKHRRYGCSMFATCMICTEIGRGKLFPSEKEGGPLEFVCNRCWDEHPREGNYAFDSSASPSKAMAWGGKHRGGKK